jgi:hypothetical protein
MQRPQKRDTLLNRAASVAIWPKIMTPLAMQKVVGSNPIISFSESPARRGFAASAPRAKT